jgi:hypothetical protein
MSADPQAEKAARNAHQKVRQFGLTGFQRHPASIRVNLRSSVDSTASFRLSAIDPD